MVVGVGRIYLALPGNDSLKGKRRVLRRIVDRTRNRFNVAVAEVGDLDEHRRAQLAFCVISNEARHANSMIDTVFSFMTEVTDAVIMDRQMELIHFGAELGMTALESGGESDSEWEQEP